MWNLINTVTWFCSQGHENNRTFQSTFLLHIQRIKGATVQSLYVFVASEKWVNETINFVI